MTPILLAANLVVFAATVSVALKSGAGMHEGAEPILRRFAFEWEPNEWWRWLSYAFLHNPADWMHVLGNCVFLYVFGPSVEDRFGRVGFTIFYVAGAAISATAHGMTSPAPLIGASGAVAAVTGAFLILFPRTHIKVLILLLFVGVYQFPALGFVAFAIARDLFFMGHDDGVSHAAHLGGYATGILVSVLLLVTRIVPREPYDIVSIFQHSRRKAEFRAAAELDQQRSKRVRAGSRAPDPKAAANEAGMTARAGVNALLARNDLAGAADAYRSLVRDHPQAEAARTLSKHNQLALANYLFETGDHATAVLAYRTFALAYPRDPQASHARLLLGLILARYANDALGARAELESVRPQLEGDDRELADKLLAEISSPGNDPDRRPANPPMGAPG